MIRIAQNAAHSLEVWQQYDSSAEVFELFTDEDGQGYIGCADTRQEALNVAHAWIREQTMIEEGHL